MAVFVGGFTLDAAEAVAEPVQGEAFAVLNHVVSLVDQSLLRSMDAAGDAARYVMLETIREFAEEMLVNSGEADLVRERHANWCLGFARHAATTIHPVIQAGAMDRLGAEHANLRTALAWTIDTRQADKALVLAADLGWFWYIGGHEREGFDWFTRVLALETDVTVDWARRTVLLFAGQLAMALGDPVATTYLEEGRSLARAAGDVVREMRAVKMLGMVAEDSGNYDLAKELLTTAKVLCAQTSER